MLNPERIAERNAARRQRGRRTKEIEIDGELITIRQLNLLERDDYNLSIMGDDGMMDRNRMRGSKARLIAMCVIDPGTGKTFMQEQDVIDAFDLPDLDALQDACVSFNGMGKKATEQAGGNS